MDKVPWIAELSESQNELIYNGFSFAVAAMGIGFVFFLVSRNRVAPQYRSAVTMSAMICGIAAYHYWRIFGQFADGGTWNEGYRYADWLLTVPLLVAELVVVSGLSKEAAKKVTPRLVVAALLMIATGYPGETAAAGSSDRTVWGIISSLFTCSSSPGVYTPSPTSWAIRPAGSPRHSA